MCPRNVSLSLEPDSVSS